MLVQVNREACIRCGLCASVCPDVFTAPEKGEAARAAEGGVTAQKARLGAQNAAQLCPTGAISIIL